MSAKPPSPLSREPVAERADHRLGTVVLRTTDGHKRISRMDRETDELDGIEAVRILVEPGRSSGCILTFPHAAVICEPDGRRYGKRIDEKPMRVGMESRIVASEGRSAVGGTLQNVGTGAARVATDVDDVRIVRIDRDRVVVRALTAAVSFRGDERSAPRHAAVDGF